MIAIVEVRLLRAVFAPSLISVAEVCLSVHMLMLNVTETFSTIPNFIFILAEQV